MFPLSFCELWLVSHTYDVDGFLYLLILYVLSQNFINNSNVGTTIKPFNPIEFVLKTNSLN